jgi:hypothetical protein
MLPLHIPSEFPVKRNRGPLLRCKGGLKDVASIRDQYYCQMNRARSSFLTAAICNRKLEATYLDQHRLRRRVLKYQQSLNMLFH